MSSYQLKTKFWTKFGHKALNAGSKNFFNYWYHLNLLDIIVDLIWFDLTVGYGGPWPSTPPSPKTKKKRGKKTKDWNWKIKGPPDQQLSRQPKNHTDSGAYHRGLWDFSRMWCQVFPILGPHAEARENQKTYSGRRGLGGVRSKFVC